MRILKNHSSSSLGPRASRPQMSAKRETNFGNSISEELSRCDSLAGGTPAVPVKGLSGYALRVALTIMLLICGHVVAVRAQDTPADNWSQFRGNQRLTGVSESAVPNELKLLWTYDAGESIESSAAIIGDTVFVGTQKGELLSLNLTNGAVFWKYQIDSPIGESSPAYSNGVVYIGDLGGWFHAVNATNGKKLWAFKAGSEIKSSPVVLGDRVLIGSYDQYLYCLSTNNGAVIWKLKTNGPVHSTPSISAGLAFIAGCDELFRGIRVSDGREMFSVASGAYTGASPALSGDSAYYGTFDNEVLMVSLKAHRVMWRYQHPQRHFPFYSSAAVSGDRIVIGGRDKMVHGLNSAGKAAWTFTTNARVESSPAVAGGRVFVGSNDGRFYVLNLNTGAKVWEFTAGAPLSASPAIGRGRIVIGSQDGRLYCFG
ncbi:MAG TPA: PQQ-binding-like beta-propeller repeat protein [Pyrinomonadaceae bacterium]|nr:PQQ-binding-like beta-propeller repeat protein [Pyrinomonadaceae bacterium]